MEVLGYIAAILIGISLGLIGGGGSILTVPVLVYLFGVGTVESTGYSLFIVGCAALTGAWRYHRLRLIDIKTGFFFGAPSIVAVFLTRKFLIPALPDPVYSNSVRTISLDMAIMVLFAILMVAAAYSMIRRTNLAPSSKPVSKTIKYPLIIVEGLVVGGLTGLVGAGGGFLIIPALVLLTQMPMKVAIGTSLMIISVKSLIGFTGDLANYAINWDLLLPFTAIAISGIFIGIAISKKISGERLKPAFGYFIFIMGVYILFAELLFK